MTDQLEVRELQALPFVHRSTLRIEIRDGRTGELKNFLDIHPANMKVYGTVNMIVSGVTNSAGIASAAYAALGSGPDVASADTTLSGELISRTVGRLSHDANSPTWSLSWSFTDQAGSISIGQAAIYTSLTGGVMYLKATFARLTKNSQDVLNLAWTQSLASA